ncbi:MAG TPA: L-rhamnose isomerase [Armatimonadota bacterium]|nr:L-rhamnose isomerase [Armatimonadota bacterium]
MASNQEQAYSLLAERLQERGVDVEATRAALKQQVIETPSWGYADSGTRFGVFAQPGAAVTIAEKLADAAQVQRYTGIAPLVATHVLWDLPDERAVESVPALAESLGVKIGSINPNVFQDREYWMGSFANRDAAVRRKAVQHCLDSVEIGKRLGSRVLSLWFADGTDYPGQSDIRQRKHWFQDALAEVYRAMPDSMTMLVEYKPFEPGLYHTDIADWGMSYVFSKKLGDRARVLVDLGHHLPGTNIEHIVAFLLDEQMLGGFHFNNRKYADDDLMVGSINPYEFFLIYNELVKEELNPRGNPRVEYMVDQGFNTKKKIPGMIQTVLMIQTTYAKALCVDRRRLAEAQANEDVVAAEQCLLDAFNTDVEPLLRRVRAELGVPEEPLKAYLASGYQERIERERGIRAGAGGLGQ